MTTTKKSYAKRTNKSRNKGSDLFLQGWNYRVSTKQTKALLANEKNPLVRKILKDMLRMKDNKYARS